MKTLTMTEPLLRYVEEHTPDPHPLLAALREETQRMPGAIMQISRDQGALMHLLVKLTGARRILEVGCYTGYSALCMASGMQRGGQLYTLDINPETAAVAKRYFDAAKVSAEIVIRLGPALDTLTALRRELGESSFDMMFIDADKESMPKYYEAGLALVRQGGLIIADNVLWSGSVVDAEDTRKDTLAIRAFNDAVARDERVDRVMVHIADGLYVMRKR